MSRLVNEVAAVLSDIFSSDQNFHIKQKPDGNYVRRSGALTSDVISGSIKESGAIGPYQKNVDSSVNWICFDFDVKKKFLGGQLFVDAVAELNLAVNSFCEKLTGAGIPYILEFSGQRGMHVWIIFSERMTYRTAFEIINKISSNWISLSESAMVAVDLFPKAKAPSGGVGMGVKIPISKHVKSGFYSFLVPDQTKSGTAHNFGMLTDEILEEQLVLLKATRRTSKAELESILGVFFELTQDESMTAARVSSILLEDDASFNLEELFAHWSAHKPLLKMTNRVLMEKALSHAERMLLVGVLVNVKSSRHEDFSKRILLGIFSKMPNFDKEKSLRAMQQLKSFYFPSQQQIESVTGERFDKVLPVDELLGICIPKYRSFIEGSFEFSLDDIKVVRAAEVNYIFQNDEVQANKVLSFLYNADDAYLLSKVTEYVDKHSLVGCYKHERKEVGKDRTLITLEGVERLATSLILKQLIYFLEFESSNNSFGYQINPGFKDRYIFKPWLNLWVEFVAGISSVIEDEDNSEYYIVKADISRFYDQIPHEPIKRLLLGKVNKKIDKRLDTLQGDSIASYRRLIEVLFFVTSNLAGRGAERGFPQGPAYARFLAELYLDNIDQGFDESLKQGEVLFYRRYVDDIFIICRSEKEARENLSRLKREVENLGLSMNDEKTKITKIEYFTEDFQRYKSQSKYTVDRASRNYNTATDTQKNLAINEFISIIQADTCEDDLAFVFSHLSGVPEVEHLKLEKVLPTLASGVGRGSMFRHLFGFVLESSDRWSLLSDVESLNGLQSEVFTSVLLSCMESTINERLLFDSVVLPFFRKLTRTKLVDENICFLKFSHGLDLDLSRIDIEVVVAVLSCCAEPLNVEVEDELIETLAMRLNAEQDLTVFVNCIYPLSMCQKITPHSLNKLSSVFYAKFSNASRLGYLQLATYPGLLYELPATRFYHLLCLFSLSDVNEDLEVLRAAWEYCISIFSNIMLSDRSFKPDNWYEQLSRVSISDPKSNVVLTAIIDGSICRGVTDTCNLFGLFHNAVIIFLANNSAIVKLVDVGAALEELKVSGVFYKWLIENDGVGFFPNKNWFEKNAFENNCILLKKDGQILIRKNGSDFFSHEGVRLYENGYGEKIESFDRASYCSLSSALSGITVSEKIDRFLGLFNCFKDGGFPNVFNNESFLLRTNLQPFSEELNGLPRLLRQEANGDVLSFPNDPKHFIDCFFELRFADETNSVIKLIRDKYLSALRGVDLVLFLGFLRDDLKRVSVNDRERYLDLAVASSLYQSLEGCEKRIEVFVDNYDRFNKEVRSKYIYCVQKEDSVDDSSPLMIRGTIVLALERVVQVLAPVLRFFLDLDVGKYFSKLAVIVESDAMLGFDLSLNLFSKCRVDVRHTDKVVSVLSLECPFESVYVVHVEGEEVQMFSLAAHGYVLRSSEHIYFVYKNGYLVLLPLSSAVSKMYASIKKQWIRIRADQELPASYPIRSVVKVSPHLDCFTQAVTNISVHRDISFASAETLFNVWLSGLPVEFHQGLCSLVAGHVVMTHSEVDEFIITVKQLLVDSSKNPFFIKKVGDFNGAHRILYKDQSIGRRIDAFHPLNIQEGAVEATLIVDNIISGSQIVKALEFYVGCASVDENYYKYYELELARLVSVLKGLKVLNLCQVFHTKKGLEYVAEKCKSILGPNVEVRILGGRDIGGAAFFGSTQNLGEKDKKLIRELFQDKQKLKQLSKNLQGDIDSRKYFRIDGINLVARYRSLPKKCFEFLTMELLHDNEGAPFERVLEKYEY
ncbi:hypothetical protein KZH41_25720 [Pseudomonas sp. YeP6b]|uniref:reverse transcriptase domain-containing protein n=2 Tax=unclassified Pseudomonas TaxID=196821 RepID=UPI0021DB28EB|nr:reverse transcriptase domain-containing protein [Pseudomonas sp. YeP6b]UXZ21835.1 hypothetical protein KZH41_25720 [Pseudomonas sp. YeP6b]